MTQTRYQYGTYAERKLIDFLQEASIYAWRSPASKSPVDVYACDPKRRDFFAFQVKRVKSINSVYKQKGERNIKKWVFTALEEFRNAKLPDWWKRYLAIYCDDTKEFEIFQAR